MPFRVSLVVSIVCRLSGIGRFCFPYVVLYAYGAKMSSRPRAICCSLSVIFSKQALHSVKLNLYRKCTKKDGPGAVFLLPGRCYLIRSFTLTLSPGQDTPRVTNGAFSMGLRPMPAPVWLVAILAPNLAPILSSRQNGPLKCLDKSTRGRAGNGLKTIDVAGFCGLFCRRFLSFTGSFPAGKRKKRAANP